MPARTDRRKDNSRGPKKAASKAVSRSKSSGTKATAPKIVPKASRKTATKSSASSSTKSNKQTIASSSNGAKKAVASSRAPAKIILKRPTTAIRAPKFSTSRVNAGQRFEARANGTDKPAKMNGHSKLGHLIGMNGYRPSESEPFMNERQRIYFRNKLLAWKDEILRQNQETLLVLHEDSSQFADVTDRATSETDRALELRARDRQRKLMAKIDAALARIEEGTYGYCEETGEPISLKRLEARPIATMSLEAQERKERMERVFRED